MTTRTEFSADSTTEPGADSTTESRGRRRKQKQPKAQARSFWKPTVADWSLFGVVFTAVLSAGLNGYANAIHAEVVWAGWLMGIAVPVIVLTLAQVAGEKWRAGQHWVSLLAGASGIALLFLSVWHCATSISLLTGSTLYLAFPQAIAIDCGLVACKVALITEPR